MKNDQIAYFVGEVIFNQNVLVFYVFSADSASKMTKIAFFVGSFFNKIPSFFTFLLPTARQKWPKLLFCWGVIFYQNSIIFHVLLLTARQKWPKLLFFVGGFIFNQNSIVFTFFLLTARQKWPKLLFCWVIFYQNSIGYQNSILIGKRRAEIFVVFRVSYRAPPPCKRLLFLAFFTVLVNHENHEIMPCPISRPVVFNFPRFSSSQSA